MPIEKTQRRPEHPEFWARFRQAFPALERMVYLNTAGGGPMSIAAARAGATYFEQSAESGDLHWPDWLESVEACRQQVADMINATPAEIAFVQNASVGLNYMAALIGPKVETVYHPDEEFPSVSLPWINQSQTQDLTLKQLLIDGSGIPSLPDDGPASTPAAITTSHVQYRTGQCVNLTALSELGKAHKMPVILDATQSFGVVPIDVQVTSVDAIAFSVYKWLGSGYGMGVLYVRDGLLEEYGYPGVGWRTAKTPYDMIWDRMTVTGQARELEMGHPPIAPVLALNESLSLIRQYGVPAIEARTAALTQHLIQSLENAGYLGIEPAAAEARAGIVTVPVSDPKSVVTALKTRNILVSSHGPRLRLSVYAYNLEAEIDLLVNALEELAPPSP